MTATAKRPKPIRKSTKVAAWAAPSPRPEAQPGAGRRKLRSRLTFQPKKRSKHPVKLPAAWTIFKQACNLLLSHRRLFGIITLIYAILNVLLVHGLGGSTSVASLKGLLGHAFTGDFSQLSAGLTVFAFLLTSAGSNVSGSAKVYQTLLIIIVSLALVWSLRQVMAGATVRVRDAFYKGMYPLIPLVLVLLVIGLQLIPMLIGASLYSLVVTNGIAAHIIEKIAWAGLFLLLSLLSLYMITSSLFALYVVALPDMTPLKALRSAGELVHGRRWTVLRKVLFLPLILLILTAVIMLPVIWWLTPAAPWVFSLLTIVSLTVVHTYMYSLYRELLV